MQIKKNKNEKFSATVELFDRPGGWYYLAVPKDLCQPYYDIQERGLIAVNATVNFNNKQATWKTSFLPMGDGSHFLALPKTVRDKLKLKGEECVEVEFSIRKR